MFWARTHPSPVQVPAGELVLDSKVQDRMISRVHAKLQYTEEGQWKVREGDYMMLNSVTNNLKECALYSPEIFLGIEYYASV